MQHTIREYFLIWCDNNTLCSVPPTQNFYIFVIFVTVWILIESEEEENIYYFLHMNVAVCSVGLNEKVKPMSV